MSRWLIAGPLIALLVIAVIVVWVSPETGEILGFFGLVVGLFAAGVLYLRRSRDLKPRERSAWLAIAVAVSLTGTGVLLVGVLTEAGLDLPAFGAHDILFLGGYAALVFALTRLARAEGEGRDWALTILDALVGAIALSALVWTAFFHELVDKMSGAPWWEAAIATAYPILDIGAVIALMILVIRRSNFHFDLRLVFLAGGLGVQVLADFTYLSRGVGSTFLEAQPAWALNLTAVALLLTTAAVVDRTPKRREFPEEQSSMWVLAWPYLFAAALLATHVSRYRTVEPGPDEILLLDAVLLVGAVIFLRQVVVIHRNRVHVERQRSELVTSVSHELRTPLTAMVGFLTLLEDQAEEFPEDARQEMLGEATDQARHMARLVSDLLMLARGDNRHMSLEISEVSLVSVMTASLRSIDTQETRIEEELDREARVRVDPDRLKQALVNLLSNAVRYGGERALVVARADRRDLILEIHDDGGGVPTRYETMIWRRFERGAHRLDATSPGLGIGLAIVQVVAESHGGRASYRASERLGGACFSVVIPGCVVVESQTTERVEVSR